MYFVYILLCSDNSLYTGIAIDPQKRFLEHKNGTGGAYTRSHKPVRIVYKELCPDKSSALKREAQIKNWTHKQKLQFLRGWSEQSELYNPANPGPTKKRQLISNLDYN